ncbi:unnamed protein product [Cyclocybe aegerita]|uniref:F-box domain-containing protein n=1 Tax=Cyclocybe aegerita TaxID=1973307 RepID=A0A8S0W605_CYCAE|nr:unnamed protein product [Cyclocybe aegerita]
MPSLLPQEILDEIIFRLYNDIEALKSCSLASSSFTAVCQSRLFSKIILRPRYGIRWPPGGGSASNFKRVLDKSPHIANYVACLEIFDTPFVAEMGLAEEWVSKDDGLAACLLRLTHLKALLITYRTDVQISHWSAELQRSLEEAMKLPSLVYLELMGCPLALLERGGTGLQHLTLRCPVGRILDSAWSALFSIADTVAARIQPVSLALHSEDKAMFLELIMRPVLMLDLSKLRRLAVHAGIGASLTSGHGAVAQLLRVCARTLEELIFYPSSDVAPDPEFDNDDRVNDPIDPSILTSLRRLTVRVNIFEKNLYLPCHDPFPWLLVFLTQLANSSTTVAAIHPDTDHPLEELTVHVQHRVSASKPREIYMWRHIASFLAANPFSNLRKATFEVSSRDVLEDLQQAGYFSQLSSQR